MARSLGQIYVIKGIGLLAIFTVLSIAVHALFIVAVTIDVGARKIPVIYGWPNILAKNDLAVIKDSAAVLPDFVFSLDSVRRDYFARPLADNRYKQDFLKGDDIFFDQTIDNLEGHVLGGTAKANQQNFYLWEEIVGFAAEEEEIVTYNAFVSDQGKVIFIYPDKLIANQAGNIRTQDYLRSAGLFMNNNFSWTKVYRVVK